MLVWCRPSVYDAGPALNQHWCNFLRLSGYLSSPVHSKPVHGTCCNSKHAKRRNRAGKFKPTCSLRAYLQFRFGPQLRALALMGDQPVSWIHWTKSYQRHAFTRPSPGSALKINQEKRHFELAKKCKWITQSSLVISLEVLDNLICSKFNW